MGRKTVFWIILVLLLGGTSLGALQVALSVQRSLETYRSPYGAQSAPAASPDRPGLSPLTGRVVLVVVDGLRDDVSHELPFLSSLRRQGAWTELRTRVPSFSKPGYAILLTGAWPEVNGVTLNAHRGPVVTDHLLREVKAAGLRSAVIGDEWWGELADGEIDYPYLYPDAETHTPAYDDRATADALRSLSAAEAEFTLIHLCGVDAAGHDAGGAGSDGYLAAARAADERLRRIAAALDFSADTLVITSDHGHLAKDTRGGGHGGGEAEVVTVPLVLVGRGIRPGRIEPGEVIDTPLTVAALLGVNSPLEARGRPRWDALEAAEPVRAAWVISQLTGTVEFAKHYLGVLARRPAGRIDRSIEAAASASVQAATLYDTGRFGEAAARAEGARQALLRELDRRRTWHVWLERIGRIPVGLAATAALSLPMASVGRSHLAAMAVGIVFLALDGLLYGVVLGQPWSFSALPGSGLGDFLRVFAVPQYLALALLAVPFLAARRRRTGNSLADGLVFVAGPYIALSWVAAVGLVVNGWRVERFLPEFVLGFLQLAALLQLGFLLPAVVVIPAALALLSRRPRDGEARLSVDPPAGEGGSLPPR